MRNVNEGVLRALPLGSVRPRGWLRDQLEIQAAGLSGNIEAAWEVLSPRSSGWRGGDGESWERAPYYLDGLVPLAHGLRSDVLRAKAEPWIEWILNSQRSDGFFGPEETSSRWGPGWWYLTPALKALAQHAEVTGDARVAPFMLRFFDHQARHLDAVPLAEWSAAREGETDLVLQWLYHRTGEGWLIEHARRLRSESLPWTRYFSDFPHARLPQPFAFRHDTHLVNVVMALKYPALWSRWSGDPADAGALPGGLEALDRHHGQAQGVIAGDEHLAGTSPTRGSELCAVVEMMFSLEHLLRITGDARYGDRLERVAYNALPAAFDGRMRVHQYLQQVNQVSCTDAPRDWVDNGPRANLFGLAPEDGCCAANFHQGWPKLISHLWMATADGGLATGALGPSELRTTVGGHAVRILEETHYPFEGRITFQLKLDAPVSFPLSVRVPAWAEGATVDGVAVRAGAYHRIARRFEDGDRVVLELPRRLRAERRHHGALSIHCGPLLMALPIAERCEPLPGEDEPYGDVEVHPTQPWNYALELDEADVGRIQVPRAEVWEIPFDEERPPLRIPVRGRRVPEWGIVRNSAGPTPQSPVRSDQPLEELQLVPFGATMLRIAEFPTLA